MGSDMYAYYDAVDVSWSEDYHSFRNWNNTYYSTGYYESPQYGVNISNYEYFYEVLNFSRVLNTYTYSPTNLTLQYRTSQDNSSWDSWTSAYMSNITINENKTRYFQFMLNLTASGNETKTPQCEWVNLTYSLNNISYYYIIDLIQTAFSEPYVLKNVTLKVQVDTISDLLNSSIGIYNFTSLNYENISSIADFCTYNVTSDYNDSSRTVKLRIQANASAPFTLNYIQSDLWIYGWRFNKTCELTANFSLSNDFNYTVFYYQFYPPSGEVLLYFYNTTDWLLHSSYSIAQNLTLVTFWLLNTSLYSKLKFKFIYTDAHKNDLNVSANISRFFFSAEYSYRLISEENRQATDFIDFNAPLQTIVLTDYYGNIIYKQLHNRTAEGYFIDIMLNYFEVYFSNFVPDTIVIFSVKDRGRTLNITVPYPFTIPVALFTGDYIVTLSDDTNKTVINMWDVTISRVKNRHFSYNLTIPVTEHKPTWLEEFWPIFIPLGFLFVVIIVVGRRYYKKRKAQNALLEKKQLEYNKKMRKKRKENKEELIQ